MNVRFGNLCGEITTVDWSIWARNFGFGGASESNFFAVVVDSITLEDAISLDYPRRGDIKECFALWKRDMDCLVVPKKTFQLLNVFIGSDCGKVARHIPSILLMTFHKKYTERHLIVHGIKKRG
jgi:hypothetical protein